MSTTAVDQGTGAGDDTLGHPGIPASNELPVGVWIVALALAVLYPGLANEYAFVVHAVRPVLFVSTTAIVLLSTILAWLLLHFLALNRDARRSTGILAVFIVVVFSWSRWTLFGGMVARSTRVGVLADVVPVLLAAALIWAAVRYVDRDRFIVVTVGVLLGVTAFLIYSLAPRVVLASETWVAAGVDAPKPNVVVLVLDGYARADVLASIYDFDNSAFVDALAERGFQVRNDAYTNYSITHASVPSMVDAGYPFDDGPVSGSELDRMRHLLSGDGTLVHAFESAGYETVMFENAWSGSNCGDALDRCHRTGLFDRSLWALGRLSPIAAIQSATVPHPFTAVSLRHIRELGDIVERDSETPLFVFAHATVPHPPMQLDASCAFVVASDRARPRLTSASTSDEDRLEARSRYIDQMRCINDEVISAVDRLIDADRDVEIVILSDHGPASFGQLDKDAAEWTEAELHERLSVLSAVRMPDGCLQSEPARTTVNTIRRTVNCALETDLAELPDRIWVAPPVVYGAGPIVDVTDRVIQIASPAER